MGRIIRINRRYYDTGTPNRSFLQVAKDLKTLGIKNYYFMLEIYDHSLVNVNPFSEKLTRDQVSRIINECTRNVWYYLREICMIPTEGGVGIHYKANRGNIAITWLNLQGIDCWLCLPRQQGKTQSALALFTWAYSFGTSNSTFIFVNKDGPNAKKNLERMKNQIDLLPWYMRFESIYSSDEDGKPKVVKAVRNATTIKHPVTKNEITTKAKASSYSSALSLARGLSAPFIHFDEPEFTEHIRTIVVNSYNTYEKSAGIAKDNRAMYGRIFTCTPGDLDTAPGMEAQQLLKSTCRFTERMYDMKHDKYSKKPTQLTQYIKSNGTNGIVYVEYDYHQIGLTDEWARETYDRMDDPITFKREVLLQRIRGSSANPYDPEDIQYIMDVMKKPIGNIIIDDFYSIDIYEELDPNIPYLMGVDCSTGTNADNNAITILNPYTVRPVAEFSCSYIGETAYERLITHIVKELIPKAVVIIERNTVGDSIIDHLLNSPIMGNLYFDKNRDLVDYNMGRNESVISLLKREAQRKTYYGVYTQHQNRDAMFAILARRVAENKDDFVTQNISKDIAGLVKAASGKILAGPGFHDDSIMSYLIALYIYYHGNNLTAFGVDIYKDAYTEIKDDIFTKSYTDYDLGKILPPEEVQAIKERKRLEKENDFESILKNAIIAAQRESVVLSNRGLIKNTVIDNTPSNVLYEDTEGEMDLSFFDEIN